MKPKRLDDDPIDRVRRTLEASVPATHRPVTTGLHEALVRIFVGSKAPRPAKGREGRPARAGRC
jgi:hypothetical protein